MTFRPRIWFPIAVVLSVANVASVGIAAAATEPWHAGIHAALGALFAVWATRLRQRQLAARLEAAGQGALEAPGALQSLEDELGSLRQELAETQERLDFAERMLAQGAGRPATPRQPPTP